MNTSSGFTKVLAVVLVLVAGCGGGSSDATTDSPPNANSSPTTSADLDTTTNTSDETTPSSLPVTTESVPAVDDRSSTGCGLTSEEVASAFDQPSVNQSNTGQETRCNFTWDDVGPWGLDVARLEGGRQQFVDGSGLMPTDDNVLEDGTPYESIPDLGDQAWAFGSDRTANVVVLIGDDVILVGAVTIGDADVGPLTDAGVPVSMRDAVVSLIRVVVG